MGIDADIYNRAESKFRILIKQILDDSLTQNERKIALYSLIALMNMFDKKYFEIVNLELINEIEWGDEV